jgi:glycosyltransferase involved in cell wall biosynthesis
MYYAQKIKFDNTMIKNSFYKRLKKLLRPQLGILIQHPPKALIIPKRYYQQKTKINLPTISIVTPSFKHAEFIERTLKSVLDQKYPHLEYIVQDGGSTDGTIAILENYSSLLKQWTSKEDKGQSNAINLGFQYTSGEIMGYLNSDDLLLPGSLQYVGEYFARHPDVEVIYGHRILINTHDKEIGRWILPPHDTEILTIADFIPQETLFWRRTVWERSGGKIDEQFSFAMDWDLILRFKEAKATFMRLPRFIGAFRVHPQQKTFTLMSQLGQKEIALLKERHQKQAISSHEAQKKVKFYLKRHLLCSKLYQLGLLRY